MKPLVFVQKDPLGHRGGTGGAGRGDALGAKAAKADLAPARRPPCRVSYILFFVVGCVRKLVKQYISKRCRDAT